jgi:hypothetical protein
MVTPDSRFFADLRHYHRSAPWVSGDACGFLDKSWPSPHPKNPFPARVATANTIRQAGNMGGFGDQARGAHEVRCEERKRDCHVDLMHAALLT